MMHCIPLPISLFLVSRSPHLPVSLSPASLAGTVARLYSLFPVPYSLFPIPSYLSSQHPPGTPAPARAQPAR
jgi:hypothetical protein